jgi:hypothetical protein
MGEIRTKMMLTNALHAARRLATPVAIRSPSWEFA